MLRPRLRRSLAGRLGPHPVLDGGRRLDDLASGRFAAITSAGATAAQRAEVEQRGGVLLAARPGTELHRWLHHGRANTAIIRPDGTVLHAGRRLPVLYAALPASAPTAR